ncbi:ferredoxin [Pseudomonas gregormendelii]
MKRLHLFLRTFPSTLSAISIYGQRSPPTAKTPINQSGCVGHARCNNVAPALYPLDDNGYIASSGFSVLIRQERLAKRGARACPERVIEVRDTPDEHR